MCARRPESATDMNVTFDLDRPARLLYDARGRSFDAVTRAILGVNRQIQEQQTQGDAQSAEWGQWLLGVYATLGMVPHPGITDRLSTLPPAERASLVPAAVRVLESVNARGGPSAEDRAGVSGVESLTAVGGGRPV